MLLRTELTCFGRDGDGDVRVDHGLAACFDGGVLRTVWRDCLVRVFTGG